MPYYKSNDNLLHFIDSKDFENLLPIGSIQITDEEYAELQKPVPPTVDDVWNKIKSERDSRKSGGIKVKVGSAFKWFHSDVDSRIQHLNLNNKARDLIAAGGELGDVLQANGKDIDDWKTLDGSVVCITAQVAFDLVTASGDLDSILHAVAERHKSALEVSDDPASYDFSDGWPEIYGGQS